MARTIHKYEVGFSEVVGVEMPKDAELLSVGFQKGQLVVWALFTVGSPKVVRRFRLYGTGFPVDDDECVHPREAIGARGFIGTVQVNTLVFHVFDRGEVGR